MPILPKTSLGLRTVASTLVAATILLAPTLANAATVRQAQWFLDSVHAIEAQNISRGDGVVVCVLDSGVDATHPDLAGAVLPGKSFGESPAADARVDTEGHGTAMAGLIAARGGGVNNALGVAPGASILPVAASSNVHDSLAEPIKYCVDNGAKVLNLSGGRPGALQQDEKDAIAYAATHDVVVVVAMGNRKQIPEPNGFASLPGVIAVTGTTQSNGAWPDSWTGPTAGLSAPALNVTTFPKVKFSSGFSSDEGTSDSAAIVSGAAALVRAKFPTLNAANVINRLIVSATDLGTPGRDELYGYGLVDAQRALTMDVPQVAQNPLGEPASSSPTGSNNQQNGTTASKKTMLPFILGAVLPLPIIGIVIWLIVRSRRKQTDTYGGMPQMPATPQQPYPPMPGGMPGGNVVMPQQPTAMPPAPQPYGPQQPPQPQGPTQQLPGQRF